MHALTRILTSKTPVTNLSDKEMADCLVHLIKMVDETRRELVEVGLIVEKQPVAA